MAVSDDQYEAWRQFKRSHPLGSWTRGKVQSRHPFGVYVDLGVPFKALLLIPDFASSQRPLKYPYDYPAVGEEINVMIMGFSDEPQESTDPVTGVTWRGKFGTIRLGQRTDRLHEEKNR